MERLHELHETGEYDLIIVDTPPTRHALDFLDAPQRLIRLLDNRVFKVLMVPARRGFRVATAALHAFVRQVGRVIGTAVIDDIISFFRAFEGMEEGFRSRADAVRILRGGLLLFRDGRARGLAFECRERIAERRRRSCGFTVLVILWGPRLPGVGEGRHAIILLQTRVRREIGGDERRTRRRGPRRAIRFTYP